MCVVGGERRRPSLGWDRVRSPAVAMQIGIGLSKILILVGAGYTSTILVKNDKLSDILGEIQSDSDVSDAIASQRTVDGKGIEGTTAQNFKTARQTEGSSAGYVGQKRIIKEPVLRQSHLNHKPRFQGIIVAGYVVRVGIIAGHAHEPLKENHMMPIKVGHTLAGYA
ncbi:unnamed protein product [Camellia sinensis]